MEFSIKSGSPERVRAGCIVVGVFEPRKLTAAGAALDRASRGHLSAVLKRGDMEGKAGTTLLLLQVPRIAAARVLLVGLGREREFDDGKFRTAVGKAIAALRQTGVADAVLCLSAAVKQRGIAWRATQAVIAATDASYRFERMKSKRESAGGVRRLTLLVSERNDLARGPNRTQAGRCDRARHESRQGPRQSAGQRLHAGLSRRCGAHARERAQAGRAGPRTQGHGEARHGFAPVGGARQF